MLALPGLVEIACSKNLEPHRSWSPPALRNEPGGRRVTIRPKQGDGLAADEVDAEVVGQRALVVTTVIEALAAQLFDEKLRAAVAPGLGSWAFEVETGDEQSEGIFDEMVSAQVIFEVPGDKRGLPR